MHAARIGSFVVVNNDVQLLNADALHVFDEMTMRMFGGNITMFLSLRSPYSFVQANKHVLT